MIRGLGVLTLLIGMFIASLAQAGVGFQSVHIPDPQGPPIEVGIWYPTDAAPAPTRLELFTDPLAVDGPVKGRSLPLVVISHGNGGSFAGHHDTAMALAQAGFVVAALTHSGDNWRDQSQATRIWERPRQLKVLIDYMLSSWPERGRLDPQRVGAFGFSAGAFTVLVAAGGEADLSTVGPHCRAHPEFFDCRLLARAHASVPAHPVWTRDPRIKAVVAAAPALGFAFGRQGLVRVRQPLQLWRAADDQVLPQPYYAEAVRRDLPTPPETHVIERAGHYDFLAPCSAELASQAAPICVSAKGFDRAAFHTELNREVVAFFKRTLAS